MIPDPSEFVLTNASVVLDDSVIHGTIVVRDGVIADVDEGPSAVAGAVDLEGDYLVPGLIELHTDNLEKHVIPRPSVHWPVMSALFAHDAQVSSAGITTVFDAIAVGGTLTDDVRDKIMSSSAQSILSAREHGHLRADHYLHMRCEVSHPQALALFEPFMDDPLVRLVSLMDHTPGQRQFVRIDKLKIYYQGKHGLTDDQFEDMIVERKALQEKYSDHHRRTLAEACRQRGLVTASHDDAKQAHIDEAHELGLTISEFPTTIEAARAAQAKGMTTIMGGPNVVRGGSHSGNVSAGELAEEGLLDALSSDYVPASLIHGAFMLHDDHSLTLPEAIATVTRNPARMVGLDDRGEIKTGKRADLARVRRLDDGTPVVRNVWREGRRVA